MRRKLVVKWMIISGGIVALLGVIAAVLIFAWAIFDRGELLYSGNFRDGSHVEITYTKQSTLKIEIKGEGTWVLSKRDCYLPEREIERVDQNGTSYKITFKDGRTLEFERPTFQWKDGDGVVYRSGSGER